jgi:FkbM family methyltransferase
MRVHLRSGLRISCRVNEFFQIIEVFLFRDYEHPDIPYVNSQKVLDIGANIGVATLWFSQVCPEARIFAFEPSIPSTTCLLKHVSRNSLTNRVTVATLAGGRQGNPLILVTGESSELSYTTSESREAGEVVWAADLKTMLAIVGASVDVMKLDCEGAEYDLILEASDDDLSQVANIVGEYHPIDVETRSRFFSRLEESGFVVSHERRMTHRRMSHNTDSEEGRFYAIRPSSIRSLP